MADSMEPCKMLWADPCCHDNDIWARRGDLVAYQLVFLCVSLYVHTKGHCSDGEWLTPDEDQYVQSY